MKPARAVERSEPLEPGALVERYVRPRTPVVLRGAVDRWPARSRWSWAWLEQRWGDAVLPVLTVGADGAVVHDRRRGYVTTARPLRDFLAERRAGRRDTYVVARIDDVPGGLAEDVDPPEICRSATWSLAKLWLSCGGTRSPLHFDVNDNLHAQVLGRKRFTLFSPRQRRELYPGRLFDGVPNASRVDLDDPDYGRFPLFANAEPWIADLEPGDALYLPRGWWHHVCSMEDSASVNFWWATGARVLVPIAAGAVKRLLGVSR